MIAWSERLLAYRLFDDDTGRMNRSVREVGGKVLLVPQFTLAADTRKGLRDQLLEGGRTGTCCESCLTVFSDTLQTNYAKVQTGVFGACMQVHSVNDGPVTFWLEV